MTKGRVLPERRARNLNAAVVGIAITLAVQAGGFIWWAATITAKLDNVVAQLASEQATKYTRSEAERDISNLRQRVERIERLQDGKP